MTRRAGANPVDVNPGRKIDPSREPTQGADGQPRHAIRLVQGRRHARQPAGEKRRGTYACGGCGLSVFSSADKYNSRTGWPSFVRPLVRATREKSDRSEGLRRTKVDCRRCGCHLGHVFGDGPPPTRLRYCINGAGLTFMPT